MRNTAFRARVLAINSVLALAAALLAAQLPPDVQVDRLWLRAERQIESGEYLSALTSLDEILDLQTEHDVATPESFWFSHAVASHEASLHRQAAASAIRYVESAGRTGEHYQAALELLDVAEAAAARQERAEREAEARQERAEREAEARQERAEREAEARRAAVDAQAEETAAREREMAKVAAELAGLAPGMEMVVIPAGSFRMGCVWGHAWCGPIHEVTIQRSFAVSEHEVTFAQWDACVEGGGCLEATTSGSRRRRQRAVSYRPDDQGWGRGRRPVIKVSWEDSQAYVRWLSSQTGAEYRLLSESEWEYAARSGTGTAYSWGNEIGSGRANCIGCGSQWDRTQTAPVGSFSANAWGLHNMHGNVSEWVQDCWNDSYNGAPSNGSAWQQGDCSRRVLRGGSWGVDPRFLRSAYRYWNSSGLRSYYYGFRVARTLTP